MDRELQQKLITTQATYQPNEPTAQAIAQKVLVMVVGPAAIGKSHIISLAAAQAEDFSKVPVFTTRPNRPDDEPGMFRSLSSNEQITQIVQKIEQGDVVQYAIHPTHGTIYGSEPSDYRAHYNLLATLTGVVEHLRVLPFESTVTIGLVANPQIWQQWLSQRFPIGHLNREKRLQEAVICFEWLLAQPDGSVAWLINNEDEAEQTAEQLLSIVRDKNMTNPAGKTMAQACLDTAYQLLKNEQ